MERQFSSEKGNRSPEESESTTSLEQFCSFAATGPETVFQAIYVCHSCCQADEKLCVCQACADNCHDDHEGLEYVGMGPSYCDCRQLGCRIRKRSEDESCRLGIETGSCCRCSVVRPVVADHDKEATERSSYIRDVFQITAGEKDEVLWKRLIQQAQELVKYSKETFWLDAARFSNDKNDNDDTSQCDLERFAWQIFQQHMEEYGLCNPAKSECSGQTGAEWWVQVKPVSLAPIESHSSLKAEDRHSSLKSNASVPQAIDLHYDKDEELAQSFGIGSFPVLSTVTYLISSEKAPPTVVFSRRYDEEEDTPISEMLVSHPSKSGKHLVFDGRLLHGAPSPYGLRKRLQWRQPVNEAQAVRITFLVNIWIDHKPVGVERLPTEIRDAIIEQATGDDSSSLETASPSNTIEFSKGSPIQHVSLTNVNELPDEFRGQIELPFVGGKATLGNDNSSGSNYDNDADQDDNTATVLLTYPPPIHESDTVLVRFGPDLGACLAYSS